MTPMMQQYTEVKKEYPDYLLFYRMGDFYELFLEDAITGSKVLDITLTSRNKGGSDDIPMCGVPFHALDNYLARVVNAGLKAAICEQITKPSKGVTLVERKVIRLVTPGTVIDESLLDKQLNNYLATFQMNEKDEYTLSYGDLSTLNFSIIQNNGKQNLINDLRKISPKEIVLSDSQYNSNELGYLSDIDGINISRFSDTISKTQYQLASLIQSLNVKTLDSFGINESDSLTIESLHRLIEYIKFTQKTTKISYGNIRKINTTSYMRLDIETLTNLEIFRSNKLQPNNKELNLMTVLDKTKTAMGARKLRYWVMNPLIDISQIKIRQNGVSEFINNHLLREDSQQLLNSIQDIERIFSRITSGLGNARDLKSLESSLENTANLLEKLSSSTDEIKELLKNKLNDTLDLSKLINTTREIVTNINSKIVENPPFSTREGGMIKPNIIDELDEIMNSISESKIWIEQLEVTERSTTKIPNLKVGFNSVFGYYIEITKSYIHLAPAHYHRKQTLVNAERYITDELKVKESIVLTAQEKINEIEFEAFTKLCQELKLEAESIHKLSEIISETDCIISFADLAIKNNYSRPTLFEKKHFTNKIDDGRHPVVELSLPNGEFIPNDTNLDTKDFFHLITGPNMAGKSTYIRQIALIQILTQIGSYVPAKKADISIVDGIYTRIGAGDALAQGLSTFMVEMIETAKILNNATSESLIILDEVGRGTSTVDGLSIAQAIIEHITDKIKSKTLFATHFHELVDLEQRIKPLKNYHFGISDNKESIKFIHKIMPGGTDKSYGIEVAKLAGIPTEVVERAKSLLNKNTSNQMKFSI